MLLPFQNQCANNQTHHQIPHQNHTCGLGGTGQKAGGAWQPTQAEIRQPEDDDEDDDDDDNYDEDDDEDSDGEKDDEKQMG